MRDLDVRRCIPRRNYADMISRADISLMSSGRDDDCYDLSNLPPTQPYGLTSGGPVSDAIINVMDDLRKYESKTD